MNETTNIIYCADVIASFSKDCIVIVERLGRVRGLALPGGKQDAGETLSTTAEREFHEETGLELFITEVLETRAKKGRDPRGDYVSTVFLGDAHGTLMDEPGKTNVLLFDRRMFEEYRHQFVMDHADILDRYFTLLEGRK